MSFKIIDRSKAALKEMAKHEDSFLLQVVEEAELIASLIAPRDVPFLALNIRFERLGQLTYKLFTTTGYGLYQELGTTKMEAQPFIQPAIAQAFKNARTGSKGLGEVAHLQGRGMNRGLAKKP